MLPVEALDDDRRVVLFLSRGGLVKRTSLAEFANPRSAGLIAAGVREGDEILDVVVSDGTAEVMLLTRDGRVIRFPESEVPLQGRTAQGVKGIDLRDDDEVVGVVPVRREASVLTVTADGAGKRTPVSEFPLQKRGGLGTLATPSSGKASPVVAALEVVDDDEVMVVTAGGKVAPVAAGEVPVQGRRTLGKRMPPLKKGDRVVEVTHSAGGSPEREKLTSEGGSNEGGSNEGGSHEGGADGRGAGGHATGNGPDESPDEGLRRDGEGQLDLLGQ